MKSTKFAKLKKEGIGAFPEYVTQLSVYADALSLPSIFVIKNKDTSEIVTVVLESEQYTKALTTALRYVEGFKKVNSWNQAYEHFMPVPVSPMLRSGVITGYRVPDSMHWSRHKDRIYYLKSDSRLTYATPVVYPYYWMPEGLESKAERWALLHNSGL